MWGVLLVLGQPRHCVCTNVSRGFSAIAEFLVIQAGSPMKGGSRTGQGSKSFVLLEARASIQGFTVSTIGWSEHLLY